MWHAYPAYPQCASSLLKSGHEKSQTNVEAMESPETYTD